MDNNKIQKISHYIIVLLLVILWFIMMFFPEHIDTIDRQSLSALAAHADCGCLCRGFGLLRKLAAGAGQHSRQLS